MANRKIAVIVGSLRKESFNRKVANVLIQLAPPTLEMEIVEIGQLPLYNEDDDKAPPAVYTDFRNKIKGFDGVLWVTPEYNRSVPGALKNAIDVGSRPYGQSAWSGKPCAVVSVSQGAPGAFGANHHLRQSMVFLDMPTMQQPEAYIGGVAKLFEGDKLNNESTGKFLQGFIDAFAAWVERNVD
jgi:chromate reductase